MTAASGWFYDESFVAATSASLSTSQFIAVALSTATMVNGRAPMIACASSTDGVAGAIGVLQDNPGAGDVGTVRLHGITKMVATTSAAVTQGALVTINASGQACVADTTGQLVLGRVLDGSTGATGTLIAVLLDGPRVWFA